MGTDSPDQRLGRSLWRRRDVFTIEWIIAADREERVGSSLVLLDLDEFACGFRSWALWPAPAIQHGDLVHARDCAVGRTTLLGAVFASDVVDCVRKQRNSRIATLLRAVVHQAVFADIQVTRAGAASPFVRAPLSDVVLKVVDAREAALFQVLHRVIDLALFLVQRLQLS